jgi:hypothetical protein
MIGFLRAILKIFVVLMLLISGAFWLHKQQLVDFTPLKQWLGLSEDWVTYYQWYDANGQLVIALKPPKGRISFTEFKAAPGLVTTDKERFAAKPATPTAAKPEPEVKVIETYRDQLKQQLLDQEMTTQCRWLVNRVFELELQLNHTKPPQKHAVCVEYQELLQRLPERHCKTTRAMIAPQDC